MIKWVKCLLTGINLNLIEFQGPIVLSSRSKKYGRVKENIETLQSVTFRFRVLLLDISFTTCF